MKRSRLSGAFSNKCSCCCLMAFHGIWLQVSISNERGGRTDTKCSFGWTCPYLIRIIMSCYIIGNNLVGVFAQIKFLSPLKPGNSSRMLIVVGARVILWFNGFSGLHLMTWPRKTFWSNKASVWLQTNERSIALCINCSLGRAAEGY